MVIINRQVVQIGGRAGRANTTSTMSRICRKSQWFSVKLKIAGEIKIFAVRTNQTIGIRESASKTVRRIVPLRRFFGDYCCL
jgi:hypothetical protein